MAFGLKLTTTQLAIVYPYVESVLLFFTQEAVTPNASVLAQVKAAYETPYPPEITK
jgi:hypothetical protein